jgi:hypothetical protein
MHHEETIRQQFAALLAAFREAFPHIAPPEVCWWSLWVSKYDVADIHAAIQKLSQHPMVDRFTTDSTGRAISAMLKQTALARAFAPSSESSRP